VAQLHRLVSARASHQATTPDEDALLYLCVFSLTLRADSEDNRNARFDRARLTIRLALVPYSTFAPFHFEINSERMPGGKMWVLPVRSAEGGSSASESATALTLKVTCPQLSHVYEYRRHQLRRGF
jgi:hypothetical protein